MKTRPFNRPKLKLKLTHKPWQAGYLIYMEDADDDYAKDAETIDQDQATNLTTYPNTYPAGEGKRNSKWLPSQSAPRKS